VQNPRFDTSLSPLCLVHLRLQRRIALGRGHGLIRLRLPSACPPAWPPASSHRRGD